LSIITAGVFSHDRSSKEIPNRNRVYLSVLVKFTQSGAFHAGVSKSLELNQISKFQISHQRNTCELLATTPENPRPGTPYTIARRDREYELRTILNDLQQLRTEKRDATYEITDTEAHLVLTV